MMRIKTFVIHGIFLLQGMYFIWAQPRLDCHPTDNAWFFTLKDVE